MIPNSMMIGRFLDKSNCIANCSSTPVGKQLNFVINYKYHTAFLWPKQKVDINVVHIVMCIWTCSSLQL